MAFSDRLELPIFNVVVIALWRMRDPDVEGSHNATLTGGFAWQGSKKGRDCPSAQWGRHQDQAADQDLDSTTLWQRSKQTSVIHKCHVPALLSFYFLCLDVEVCSETDPSLPPISLIILLWAILVCLVVNLMPTYHIALELFQCALLILGWSDFNDWLECIRPSLTMERSWLLSRILIIEILSRVLVDNFLSPVLESKSHWDIEEFWYLDPWMWLQNATCP